ncbi:MAG TPA: FAD binding domain-containing protein [Pseudonocardia sp.]|jgi:carbon-monoxide dehydrogenase medium subunit
MRPPPFDYLEPTSVAQACADLARHRERCAVLAGGQSLVAQLNSRLRRPEFVLSIARIPELAIVSIEGSGPGSELSIGASVTQREVQRGPAGDAVPVLRAALDCVGHVPTRNRGTVGGSIAFADPTAELPAVLLGLGGSVRLRSDVRERTVPADEFFLGPFRTAMWPDELLTAVCLPVPDGVWVFEQRHFRRHAKVSVVAGLDGAGVDSAGIDGGWLDRARLTVAVAGVTDTPVLLADAAERFASGVTPSDGIAAVAVGVAGLVTPNADHYGSPEYRRRLAVAATEAALRRVLGLAPKVEAA